MPESIAHAVKDFWALIAGAIGFIVWLVRLEFRAINNSKDLKAVEARLKEQRAEDLERAIRSEDRIYTAIQDLRKEVQEAIRK